LLDSDYCVSDKLGHLFLNKSLDRYIFYSHCGQPESYGTPTDSEFASQQTRSRKSGFVLQQLPINQLSIGKFKLLHLHKPLIPPITPFIGPF